MLNVTLDEHFIDNKLAELLLNTCHTLFNHCTRRTTLILGDDGLVYDKTPALKWLPEVLKVKEKLEKLTGQHYNFCAIMCYPNGQAVIKKHRDKEIPSGSEICGLSLGCTRRLKLTPIHGGQPVIFNLPHGSLYSLLPPTNDYWLHEILPEEINHVRYSLTFRNIPNPLTIQDLIYCPAILKSGKRKGEPCGACVIGSYCGKHLKLIL